MDIDKLKQQVLASWHDGGMETLVKVMPLGSTPDNTRPIGYCTKFKYIAGRTAREIEGIVGFAADTKLVHGAEVFTVTPLPKAHQFELRGYSNTPAGVSTSDPLYVPHALYPPGYGAPQWDLCFYDQSHLLHLLTLGPGVKLSYMSSRLPSH